MVFNEISLKQQVAKLPLTEQFSGFLKVCQELKHRNKDNDFYYTDELMTEEIANEYTRWRTRWDMRCTPIFPPKIRSLWTESM